MENKNLIYKYPLDEFSEEFEQEHVESLKGIRKTGLVSVSLIGTSLILLIIDSFLSGGTFSTILFTVGIILLIIGFLIMSSAVRQTSPHKLSIEAYDDSMILTYYTTGIYYKKVLKVAYSDIVSARFSDSDFTEFQIAFKSSGESFIESYNKKGDKTSNVNDNLFLFRLNSYSYEQGFFMYYAKNFFDVNGLKNFKKIEKKFGTEDEYFDRL
jgi:hypothetical protein